MTSASRARVRQRANNCREYCQLPQAASAFSVLHIEHIRPSKHGGTDDEGNLCLACLSCNLHKGPNLTGIDPVTNAVTELFNPRLQDWDDHFAWNDIYLVGKTGTGRTTVQVLGINSTGQLARRAAF